MSLSCLGRRTFSYHDVRWEIPILGFVLTSTDTAWERIPLDTAMKQAVWAIQNGLYSLYEPGLKRLRKQLPEQLPDTGRLAWKVIEECKALFLQLDLFFVKVCIIPS
jgi:hypothetical protein